MQPIDDLSLAEYRALAEFRFRLRRFLRAREEAARAAGLEPQHYQLLLALKGLPETMRPTIGSLAERLQLKHHSTVELVDRLEERGLVQRSRGEADRRQVLASLTPHGEHVLRLLALQSRGELRSDGPALVAVLHALIGDGQEIERGADSQGQRRMVRRA